MWVKLEGKNFLKDFWNKMKVWKWTKISKIVGIYTRFKNLSNRSSYERDQSGETSLKFLN